MGETGFGVTSSPDGGCSDWRRSSAAGPSYTDADEPVRRRVTELPPGASRRAGTVVSTFERASDAGSQLGHVPAHSSPRATARRLRSHRQSVAAAENLRPEDDRQTAPPSPPTPTPPLCAHESRHDSNRSPRMGRDARLTTVRPAVHHSRDAGTAWTRRADALHLTHASRRPVRPRSRCAARPTHPIRWMASR